MLDKTNYLHKLDVVEKVMSKHGLVNTLADDLNRLRMAIENHSFRVLMMGCFSAGKSAFLNQLTGRNLLKESQAPETAIAAELVYDTDEFIEAVSLSGERRRFPMQYDALLSPEEWTYLVYHVDSDFLKAHPDLILVDMPGLDSNLELHNKAIAQYITRGSAYILLVSCEDGTLKKSTSDFIREVAQYPQSISCFVSKSDLKEGQEIGQIVAQIQAEISGIYGEQVSASPISVFNRNFTESVESEIVRFAPQQLFEQKYTQSINSLISTSVATLCAAQKTMALDVEAIDQEIERCAKRRDEIKCNLDQSKKDLERKYSRKVIPSILDDVERGLMEQADRLTSALTISPEAFNASVNSILRPILFNSTQQHITDSFDEYVGQFNMSFLDDDSDEFRQSVMGGLNLVSSFVEQIKEGAEKASSRETAKRGYEAIASVLAIVTDFINPVLEIIVVFLPTIMSFISKLNRQSQYDDLRQKIQQVVIPEIVTKISPQIESAVCETRDSMLEELEMKMEHIISAQEAALSKALEEKTKITDDFQAKHSAYQADIDLLNQQKI